MILSGKNAFGRSTDSIMNINGARTIVFFNEAEAVCDLDAPEPEDLELKAPKKKNSQEKSG